MLRTLLPRQKALAVVRDVTIILFVFTLLALPQSWGELVASPSPAAFGNVSVGTSKSLAETLSNSGVRKLTIRQVSVTGTGFALRNCPVPITLVPRTEYHVLGSVHSQHRRIA